MTETSDKPTKLQEAFAKLEPTIMTQNALWYKVTQGPTKQAIDTVLKHASDVSALDTNTRHELGRQLGQTFGVIRNDTYFGAAIIYPEVFHSPYNDEAFYILCPIGLDTQTADETHFTPEDATQLNDDEVAHVTSGLFPPQGGAIAIISRQPISRYSKLPQLRPEETSSNG